MPRGVGPDHGVQDREELSHARGERHVLGLAGRAEPMVEGPDYGIASGADQRSHEEGRAHGRPTAPDQALAFERPTVAGKGRHPDQSRNLFTGQRPELRELADERAAENRATTGRRAQEIVLGAPHRAGFDGGIQIPIDILQLAVEPVDVLSDSTAHGRQRMFEPIALGHEHREHLAPPGQQRVERDRRLSGLFSPVTTEAQQAAKIARIGYLGDNPGTSPHAKDAFLQGLRDLSYVEGRNFVIEYRFAEGKAERLRALAAELVALKVDVIVVGGTPATHSKRSNRRGFPG